MKIAIMAAGGVGGYFGARLAAAGEDVRFIARGAHLAALRAHGLKLASANGNLHLKPVFATDDPATIGEVDIVIFAVKQYDTEEAATAIIPLIGTDTGVISLQNGMNRPDRLQMLLGRDHVMGGAAYTAPPRGDYTVKATDTPLTRLLASGSRAACPHHRRLDQSGGAISGLMRSS